MGFIKNIARKILRAEIEIYEKTIRDMRSDKTHYENAKNSEMVQLLEEQRKILEEKCKLEKENEILRQYYDLDKEPSDEIKTKIHIDLEINRLKEEKDDLKNEVLRLTAICRPPVYIQQPYTYYGFGYRPF